MARKKRRTFEDFADEAEDLFGLNAQEAADLLEHLEGENDFNMEKEQLRNFMVEAFDALDDITDLSAYDEAWWGEELDPRFPDDDWLDPGEEWEITFSTKDTP